MEVNKKHNGQPATTIQPRTAMVHPCRDLTADAAVALDGGRKAAKALLGVDTVAARLGTMAVLLDHRRRLC